MYIIIFLNSLNTNFNKYVCLSFQQQFIYKVLDKTLKVMQIVNDLITEMFFVH